MAQSLQDTTPLLVNFGGPRNPKEIFPFLKELLCDRNVIPRKLPSLLHDWLFQTIAYRRSKKIQHDYEKIGGRSPIYFDTETLAEKLSFLLQTEVLTFHRYLPETHFLSLKKIENCKTSYIRVLPLFPQFTYATSGSIAQFFASRLPRPIAQKLEWISSYPDHPRYVKAFQQKIEDFLNAHHLKQEETLLLFSAHGLPKTFVDKGDPYQAECERSFRSIIQGFPQIASLLCYQSKFGKGEWIRPYTVEICEAILEHNAGRQNIVFVPLSFTSDHIETLFEIEYQYLPLIRNKQLKAYRCPALNVEPNWIDTLSSLILDTEIPLKSNLSLVRPS